MSYTVEGYEKRAEECVRLANLTMDDMIRQQLLSLRQSYLRTAVRLRALAGETYTPENPSK
jgi:hypothetical protein